MWYHFNNLNVRPKSPAIYLTNALTYVHKKRINLSIFSIVSNFLSRRNRIKEKKLHQEISKQSKDASK